MKKVFYLKFTGMILVVALLVILSATAASARPEQLEAAPMIAAGNGFTVGLKSDGTLIYTGKPGDTGFRDEVYSWHDVSAIDANSGIIAGLKRDGTVISNGVWPKFQNFIGTWEDIVSISVGDVEVAGIRSDGTVLATGVDSRVTEGYILPWRDIVSISLGHFSGALLKSDGTVLNRYADKEEVIFSDMSAISVGDGHLFVPAYGLKRDGTVVCKCFGEDSITTLPWSDITAIASGGLGLFGLKNDGTVVNNAGVDLSSWTNIVAIDVGKDHVVGLRSNGTVIAAGSNDNGQCNVGVWNLLGRGDSNSDGEVTLSDAVLSFQVVSGKKEFQEEYIPGKWSFKNAKVTAETPSKITLADAIKLFRYVAGKTAEL